ncbi:alpha/beta hydrolase [Mesorhizobium sp. B2-3-4]|uniref:alpha/beta fold hydrolase n=1 Tax=Mesorhizobium sp. B2-3-4 TaxID=2589959 RepID=UPI0011280F0F|nr:alpha/beta hydrolase [Mesorhizobium sp. B2-3-4]TPM27027.1 alpha/beta hydrolase [Mesorhizobium sp. B2-3-4]
MFKGFRLERISLTNATLRVRVGGVGPAVLLLHGHPRTHVTWHKVADILAKDFTVVCPDLRGFGQSSIPEDTANHSGSSKRAKAHDCIELMHCLRFDRFAVVGHDRGSYTAFRLAMDHPAAVTYLMILDGVPILEALERCDERFAAAWWHWFFFAQPDKPERAINVAPEQWYGGSPAEMGEEPYADYLEAIRNPDVVHGMIEDYRAGLSIDHIHDAEDRRLGRSIQCPMAVLWSLKDDLEPLYGDVLGVWKPWAGSTLTGKGVPSGHHMAEEIPEILASEISSFIAPDRPPNQP